MCVQTGVEFAAECTRRVGSAFAGVLAHHFTLRCKAQTGQTALYAQREALILSNIGPTDFAPVSAVVEAYRVPWC